MLFVRVGWMHFYAGPIPGDEGPVGGGRYNEQHTGGEAYNFLDVSGHLYGYAQPPGDAITLERIDSGAAKSSSLNNVLVVMVSRRPSGGQVIVGWFKDAKVFRECIQKSPGKPDGFGHFFSTLLGNGILLPIEKRSFEIPSGKGAMGQSNICYPLEQDGTRKKSSWMKQALEFIDGYNDSNLLSTPESDAEDESARAVERALAGAQGQGFARTPQERRAIEHRAMDAARKFYESRGFIVTDVSAQQPYDLHCKKIKRHFTWR